MPNKRPKLLTNFNSPRRDFAVMAELIFTGASAHEMTRHPDGGAN